MQSVNYYCQAALNQVQKGYNYTAAFATHSTNVVCAHVVKWGNWTISQLPTQAQSFIAEHKPAVVLTTAIATNVATLFVFSSIANKFRDLITGSVKIEDKSFKTFARQTLATAVDFTLVPFSLFLLNVKLLPRLLPFAVSKNVAYTASVIGGCFHLCLSKIHRQHKEDEVKKGVIARDTQTIRELTNELNAVKKESTTRSNMIDNHNQQIRKLNADLATVQRNLDDLIAGFNNTQAVNDVAAQVNKLAQQFNALVQANQTISGKNNDLDEGLARALSAINALQIEVDTLKKPLLAEVLDENNDQDDNNLNDQGGEEFVPPAEENQNVPLIDDLN